MHGQAVLPEHLAVRAHVNEVIHASSPVSPLLSYSKRLLTPQEETRKVLAARVANQDDSSDSSLLQKESGRRMSLNNSNEELPPRQQALKHDIDMVVPVPVVLSVTTDGIKHHRASSCRSSSIFNMEAMETAPNNTHGHFNSSLNATKTLSIESTPKSARRSNASASTSLHLRACSARTNRSVTGSTVRRVFTNESLKGSSVSSLGGESYAAHDTLAQYAKVGSALLYHTCSAHSLLTSIPISCDLAHKSAVRDALHNVLVCCHSICLMPARTTQWQRAKCLVYITA